MIAFTKMQGIGNDFVMIDALRNPIDGVDLASLSKSMNDRRFGVGGDGVIIIERGSKAAFRMRMFNPDGSESEMCGNGIRCFARLLRDHGHSAANEVAVETGAGVLTVQLRGDDVRVDMGPARLTRADIGMTGGGDARFVEQPIGHGLLGTAVSMGNPHLVVFVDDVAAVQLAEIGPVLERHEAFPHRTNVHFAQVLDPSHIRQRTWERGAGITLACGTGACSVAVAAAITGRADSEVTIHLPGGDLSLEYAESGHVFMTGPAEAVFEGAWLLPTPK